MQLSWADLLTDNIPPDDFARWLQPWSDRVGGNAALAFMTKFGTWFLRRPEGHVEMLDVFTGELERIADTYELFMADVNDRVWQEIYLLSQLVYQLHQAGQVAGPGQCYALAPHPALGGPNPLAGDLVDTRFIQVMDANLWQRLCVQFVLGSQRDPDA